MDLLPLPALTDNYIWVLSETTDALIVDPGDAQPVFAAFERRPPPTGVLLTHHHPDHIGGTPALLQCWPELQIFAPHDERITFPCTRVGDGDVVPLGTWRFQVLAVPGHTTSHVAYHGHGVVFCGDTLFSMGCGRLFEGTPAQMVASLDRLSSLSDDTRIACGHEYTVANAAFARAVEPGNAAVAMRQEQAASLRRDGRPTLPAVLADERATNPFLRIDAETVRAAIAARLGRAPSGRVETFAELRRWKDGFRG